MAAGNQDKAIWALLVIAAKTRKEINSISAEPDKNLK